MARCGLIFATWDELKILAENDDDSCIDVEVIEISDSSDAESIKEHEIVEIKNEPAKSLKLAEEVKTEIEPMTVYEITPLPEVLMKFGNDESQSQSICDKTENDPMAIKEATALSEISMNVENDDNSSKSEDSCPETILPCFTASVLELLQNPVVSDPSCTTSSSTFNQQDKNTVHCSFFPLIMKTESLSTSTPDSTTDKPQLSNFYIASDNWSGAHNFNLHIKHDASVKKNESALFCKSTRKLYTCKDIPFFICCSAQDVPSGTILRATGIFKLSIYAMEIVRRCPSHAQQDAQKGIVEYEHLIQSLSEFAKYEKNSTTGRYSVIVPYKPPKEGTERSIYVYKLTCFNTCVGGINRRSVAMLFTLEKDGCVLGRQSIDVKVCACPKRDIKYDVDKLRKKHLLEDLPLRQYVSGSTSENTSSNNYTESNNSFSIKVNDLKLYEFLKEMKTFFETSRSAMNCIQNRRTDTSRQQMTTMQNMNVNKS